MRDRIWVSRKMASGSPLFDDRSYMSREKLDEQEDGSYDLPSSFLDRVPDPQQKDTEGEQNKSSAYEHVETKPQGSSPDLSGRAEAAENTTNQVEESADYTSIDDLFVENGEGLGGQSAGYADSQSDSDDGPGEMEGGEGGKKAKFTVLRQSFTDREEKEWEEGDKIYVQGNFLDSQPMVSFKSEQIYQGLLVTDEQKQQLGIRPEPLYMTAILENRRDELEHMSIEMLPKETKPGEQCRFT